MKFDPNTPESIGLRIQSNFSSGYLTLISIIQGVAFGILVSEVKPIITGGHWSGLILPCLSLLSLAYLVFYYHWFVSIIYSSPNVLETLIPIIVSVFEVIPFFFFENHKIWWLLTSIFYFIAIFAFCLTMLNIKHNSFNPDNESMKMVCLKETKVNIYMLILCSLVSVMGYLNYKDDLPQTYSILPNELSCVFAIFLLAFLMVIKTHHLFLKKIFQYTNMRHENIDSKSINRIR